MDTPASTAEAAIVSTPGEADTSCYVSEETINKAIGRLISAAAAVCGRWLWLRHLARA